jgi:zinc-ribbon domain
MNEGAGDRLSERGEGSGGASGDPLAIRESIVAIRQRFNYLTELWQAGELDADRYLKELSRLVYFDPEGDCWYISPHNGNWYRVTDTGQAPGEPPMFLYRPAEDLLGDGVPGDAAPPAVRFCKHCGEPRQEGAAFCSQCGMGFP